MRKLLLLSLALGLGTLVTAQNAANQVGNLARTKIKAISTQDAAPIANPLKYNGLVATKGVTEVEPIDLFSSLNVYTLLVEEQTCITYNADIDAVMFTARGGGGEIGTGNDICTAISLDGGATFERSVAAAPPSQGMNRYPSGAIYNPAGNTDPANAYKVLLGAITGGSGWQGNNFSTNNWDNSAPYSQFFAASGLGTLIIRGGLDVDANGVAHVANIDYSDDLSYAKAHIFRGTFDAGQGGFVWTDQEFDPPFARNSSNEVGQIQAFGNVAFSPDGSIGYAMYLSCDNRNSSSLPTGPQPIVYKSTNSGQTWELMAMLDLEDHPIFQEYLFPLRRTWGSSNEIVKPNFWEGDMVVDHNGNLHIMAKVLGLYSDDPDSLTYYFSVETGGIFEVYNTSQGDNWDVRYIDTLQTRYVRSEESGYGAGDDAVGWGMRVQASRTPDGKTVFAVWTDTDKGFFSEEVNLYPDVRAWGHRVDAGLFTEVTDFTNQGSTYGENYFMFVSPTTIVNNDGTFEIPVTKSDIRTTNDPGQRVYHDYLKGIVFDPATDFPFGIGVDQINYVNSVSAYPNPVNESLTIEVNLIKASNIKIEMTNLLGQHVYAHNANGVAGTNLYKVDVSAMQSGIYFYSITVNGQMTTHKVVVK